jgi:hypothetical protein
VASATSNGVTLFYQLVIGFSLVRECLFVHSPDHRDIRDRIGESALSRYLRSGTQRAEEGSVHVLVEGAGFRELGQAMGSMRLYPCYGPGYTRSSRLKIHV